MAFREIALTTFVSACLAWSVLIVVERVSLSRPARAGLLAAFYMLTAFTILMSVYLIQVLSDGWWKPAAIHRVHNL